MMEQGSIWNRGVAAALLLLAGCVMWTGCFSDGAGGPPTVWVVDDGEKIKKEDLSSPLKTGTGNSIWSPGSPITLFGLRNETVAFQVIVQAGGSLDNVTVDLERLTGPGGAAIANAASATDPMRFTGRRIERFVEHYLKIKRASYGFGWKEGSGPRGDWTGWVPDALIPVEWASKISWARYPLRIDSNKNGAIWIDITIPADQAAGLYSGEVVVQNDGTELARLPVRLEVAAATLPDWPVQTMVYWGDFTFHKRFGGSEGQDTASIDQAKKHLKQLMHRHRLSPLHLGYDQTSVSEAYSGLEGTLYTPAQGYEGPAQGVGDGALCLGPYGSFGEPSAQNLSLLGELAESLANRGIFSSSDVFLYSSDEDCNDARASAWRSAFQNAGGSVGQIEVARTCSKPAAGQPVDVVIKAAEAFSPAEVSQARDSGQKLWIYAGTQPYTGNFLIDAEAVAPRINGWIAALYDVGRWFCWESTYWSDSNNGGEPTDVFEDPETFVTPDGAVHMSGDGTLVYPGKQVDVFSKHSIGVNGLIASIRMKNWRRGIQDAGYYQLARQGNAAQARAVAQRVIPRVLNQTTEGAAPSWSSAGKDTFYARKELLNLIPK